VKATEVTVGLTESNGSLLPGIWRDSLHVTCGLTACTPRSAPGPTLGNEYGKTLPFFIPVLERIGRRCRAVADDVAGRGQPCGDRCGPSGEQASRPGPAVGCLCPPCPKVSTTGGPPAIVLIERTAIVVGGRRRRPKSRPPSDHDDGGGVIMPRSSPKFSRHPEPARGASHLAGDSA